MQQRIPDGFVIFIVWGGSFSRLRNQFQTLAFLCFRLSYYCFSLPTLFIFPLVLSVWQVPAPHPCHVGTPGWVARVCQPGATSTSDFTTNSGSSWMCSGTYFKPPHCDEDLRIVSSAGNTLRSAPTASAKSVLFTTNKSLCVIPGPPLRGTLSPPWKIMKTNHH